MANFGYPYNDLVICKDSTDYPGYATELCHKAVHDALHLGEDGDMLAAMSASTIILKFIVSC